MSARRLRLVNGRFRKKGNTPYKWYNSDKRVPNALKNIPLRVYPILPEDQAHLDSIREAKNE